MDDAPSPTPAGGGLRRLAELLAFVLQWLLAAGLLAALSRDMIPLLAIVFYATPPLVLAVGCLLRAGLVGAIGQRRRALAALLAALLATGLDRLQHPLEPTQPPVGGRPLRIVQWNAFGVGFRDVDDTLQRLAALDAELLVINEFGPTWPQHHRDALAQRLPDFQLVRVPGAVVLVRGQARRFRTDRRKGRWELTSLRVQLMDGRELTVLVVDIASNPLADRGEAFAALGNAISHNRPLVIAGDFNTPATSVHWEPLASRFAASSRASWPSKTWPVPVPVMVIDHVLIERERGALHAVRTRWTPVSDHAMVIVEASLRD